MPCVCNRHMGPFHVKRDKHDLDPLRFLRNLVQGGSFSQNSRICHYFFSINPVQAPRCLNFPKKAHILAIRVTLDGHISVFVGSRMAFGVHMDLKCHILQLLFRNLGSIGPNIVSAAQKRPKRARRREF